MIDLNTLPPHHKYSVSIEREETVAELRVRLFKDVTLFMTALGFVILIISLCYLTLASNTASPEEKKWAMSVLSAAAGGIIGYLIRK